MTVRMTCVFSFATFLVLGLCFSTPPAAAQEAVEFRYQYAEGELYRILSTVDQYVFYNGEYSHRANLLNRIAVRVAETNGNTAQLEVEYLHSAQTEGLQSAFQYEDQYHSDFRRDVFGNYEVPDEYYVPTVRDVPIFPEEPVSPGDTWTRDGEEVHDLRRVFEIEEPFRFTMPVRYEYLGVVERDGKTYDQLSISYNVFFRVPSGPGPLRPVLVTGYSDQLMYWDRDRGRPHEYEEEYLFIWELASGDSIRYEGTAEARVVESSILDRDRVADDIRRDLDGLENTNVEATEDGVTISLEDIRFLPDSAVLIDTEREKLRRIAEVLARYPDRDLMVTGHTALAGTEAGRQALSEQRARAVGEFLLELSVRERDQLVYRGMGARDPVAPNDTEANMRKNRRVEITIMEN